MSGEQSEPEKPIHVRVAEALGCKPEPMGAGDWFCSCEDRGHTNPDAAGEGWLQVAAYDTDWSATGPIIERYEITVAHDSEGWMAEQHPFVSKGTTPLLAVCHLLIALGEAGKL